LDNTAVAYQILIARTIEFTEPLVWDSGKTFFNEAITNGSRTPEIPYGGTEGILEGGRYYWKIRIWDEKDGVSRYSMVAQFGTHSRPSSPTGLEMNGTSTPGVLNSKKMSFSAIYYDEDGDRASAYQIQISTSSEFETVVLDSGKKSTNVASGTRSEQYYYDGSSLLNNSGTTYYWRIRFYDTDDMEENGQAMEFSMIPYHPLAYSLRVYRWKVLRLIKSSFTICFLPTFALQFNLFYCIFRSEILTCHTFKFKILKEGI